MEGNGLPKKGVTVKTSSSSSLSNGDVINSINGVEVHGINELLTKHCVIHFLEAINVIAENGGISTDIVPNLK